MSKTVESTDLQLVSILNENFWLLSISSIVAVMDGLVGPIILCGY